MTVWVLVFYMAGYQGGGPAVIDNITTSEECQRVLDLIPDRYGRTAGRCVEVRKIKP